MVHGRTQNLHRHDCTSASGWLIGLALSGCAMLSACGGGSSNSSTSSGNSNSGGGSNSVPYSVGGSVSGLAGSGLVLQDNGGNNLNITANGPFTFTGTLMTGAAYAVSVATQPSTPSQTCTVTNGSGTVSSSNVTNVSVACSSVTYTVGGNVTGLTGSGLVLQDNGGNNLSISGNGPFTLTGALMSGAGYAVSVATQPTSPSQTCAVTNGSGTVSSSNVTSVSVVCTLVSVTVGGSVTGLAAGSDLVLQDNGGNNLSITSNGTFTFTGGLTSGQPYAVTVQTQPSSPPQYCTVAGGAGTTGSANVSSVVVTCRTTGKFAFVSTTYGVLGGVGLITGFALDPSSGLLTIQQRYKAVSAQPLGIALDTSGLYAYVAYQDATSVATETITPSGPDAGLFTETSYADNGSGNITYATAVDPTAAFVFAGGWDSGGTLFVYSASAGVLTQLGTSPYTLGGDPYGLAVDPAGKFVYVPNSDGGQLWAFSINADGSLNQLTNAPYTFQSGNPTNSPYAIAVNPNGGYLYITDNAANTVTVYSYDSGTGAVSEVGSPISVGTTPDGVAVDPTGQFLYVANSGDGTVSGFTIGAAGALTAMAGSPFQTGGGSSTTPTAVAVEPSGQYAYVANGDAQTVSMFSITPVTGVLVGIGTPQSTVGSFGGSGGASALAVE